jgi:xanthine dehydrogenase accessory factor
MKEIAEILQEFELRRDQPLALATLVRTKGSSYRRPGARMLICLDGRTTGCLSGGCLEEEVSRIGMEVIQSGKARLMSFDTRLRFGCNGTIEVLVEKVRHQFLREMVMHRNARRSFRIATVFEGEETELGSRVLHLGEEVGLEDFVQAVQPPVRLVIFGQGPDSAPLRLFARTLGWPIAEVDQAEDLPALVDERTAVIIKAHNYGRDFAALRHLLPLSPGYIGLLGPRRRRNQLMHVLSDEGFTSGMTLFAPAGLDLGAETPEEIALAIVAEIQCVLAQATGESLRTLRRPIHAPPVRFDSTPVEQCIALVQ